MTHRHGWQQRAMSRNVSSLAISVLPGLMCCRTKSSGDPEVAKVGRLLLCWSNRLSRGLEVQEAQVRRAMTRINLAKNRWRFRGFYARCAGGREGLEKVCARFGGERKKACGPCWPLYLEDVASHRACRHPLATGKRNLPVGTRMGGAADSWAAGLGPQSPEDSRTCAEERVGAKTTPNLHLTSARRLGGSAHEPGVDLP